MKTILTLIAAFVCTSLSAQISKGQWLVGGSLSGMSQKGGENNFKEKTIQTPINVGYFLGNGMALGIRGSFQYKETSYNIRQNYYYSNYQSGYSTYEVKSKTQQYSAGPFLRAYLMPNTQKLNVYIEPHFAYGHYEGSSNLLGSGVFTENFQSYNLSLAPVIFLTPSSSLEFILSYNYTNFAKSETNSTLFLFGVGFQVFLGKAKAAKVQ